MAHPRSPFQRRCIGLCIGTVLVTVFVTAFVTAFVTGLARVNSVLAQSRYPFTFTDDGGVEVTVSAPPQSIVAFGPSNAEILFALGLGELVVGLDHWSTRLGEAAGKVDLGTFSEPSFEALVALQPDLVLVTSDHAAQHRARMEALGFTVAQILPASLDELYERILLLGEITNELTASQRLVADLRQRVERIKRIVGAVPDEERVKVYVEVWNDPLMTVGGRGHMHDVISTSGGHNVFADTERSTASIDPELVIERDPDVVILLGDDGRARDVLEGGRPGWEGVSAFRTGRVHFLDENLLSRAGPRLVDGVEALARLFYPERFGELHGR